MDKKVNEINVFLCKRSRSISAMNKPDKIWMHNTNMVYAIASDNVNIGNIRETFFLQMLSGDYELSIPEKGDFLVDNKFIFEVGGKNKTKEQIKGLEHSFLVKDNVEVGVLNQIPLWLFGILY